MFTNKYADVQLSASGYKRIQRLFEKDDFNVVTSNKVVTSEKIQISTQAFNSHFVDDIKYLYTDKANEKNSPVVHTYNDEKKNFVLIY